MNLRSVGVVWGIGLLSLALLNFGTAWAQGHEYTGVKKCGMCHNAAEKGAQLDRWKGSLHAKAYRTLATPRAKEVGQKLGVTDPQKDGKCLKCHMTAFGVKKELLGFLFKIEDGVQCESCHGPGGDYGSKEIMQSRDEAIKNGMVRPNEGLCLTCHNPSSPTYKPFDYKIRKGQIEHKNPVKNKDR